MTAIKRVLFRARLTFSLLVVLFFSLAIIAGYTGWKSGEIKKNIIGPVSNAIRDLASSFEYKPASPSAVATTTEDLFKDFEKQPEVKEQQKPVQQPTKVAQSITVPSQSTTIDYDAARKAQEEWWQKAQADQQKFAQDAAARQAEFAKQAQQNMADFQKQSDQKVQQFQQQMVPQVTCTTNSDGVKICK